MSVPGAALDVPVISFRALLKRSRAPSVILVLTDGVPAAASDAAATRDVFSTTVFRMPLSGEVGPERMLKASAYCCTVENDTICRSRRFVSQALL